jgi:hypothetical protein
MISKSLPYFLLFIGGILISFNFKNLIKNTYLKSIFILVISFLPFVIGFAIHPIYQGDYSLTGKKTDQQLAYDDFSKNINLAVITIPNCPYCFESIQKLKVLKERNPLMNIEFIVCSDKKSDLTNYKIESKNKLKIKLAKNMDTLAKLANYKFPTFVQISNKKPQMLWSNSQFGVRAIDFLEKQIENKQ